MELPALDGLFAPPRLRRDSLDPDQLVARTAHPCVVSGTNLSPGAPPVSGCPQPPFAAAGRKVGAVFPQSWRQVAQSAVMRMLVVTACMRSGRVRPKFPPTPHSVRI